MWSVWAIWSVEIINKNTFLLCISGRFVLISGRNLELSKAVFTVGQTSGANH